MSLIYDYLKIHGKSGLEEKSDVEVPSPLKRSIPVRPNFKKIPAVTGICLAVALLLFFVYSIFTPGHDVSVPEKSEFVPQVKTPRPLPVYKESPLQMQTEQPLPADTAVVAELRPVAVRQEEAGPVKPDAVQDTVVQVSEKIQAEILVFPEPETAARTSVDQTAEVSIDQPTEVYPGDIAAVRQKIPQPLELNRSARKIMVTEQPPFYTEAEPPAVHETAVRQAAEPVQRYEEKEVAVPIPVPKADDIPAGIYTPGPGEFFPDKSRKFYQAGLQAQMRGDQRSAEAYYTKTLEEDAYHIEAMINLSALYVQQQRYDQAEDIILDIFRIDPENSKALVNMGVISLFHKDIVRAEEYFQAALDANPTEENALVNLAYLAEKRGDLVSTERYYRHLLQISPGNIEVLLAYGHLLEEDRRYSEAVALYRDCLKLDYVKKDQQLHDSITQRMRLLKGAVRR